ncbi:MAG TPA: hypothetical protein VF615_29615 [Longimicrobiaceae bacterium]|jgi:hypothetical protein
MSRSDELCQACRAVPARTTFLLDDDLEPARLCLACEDRLETGSLRPLEWFNLAAVFGPEAGPLHDDLYLEDGSADQPLVPVENPERYPAPTLAEVWHDVERLVDYAMTRHFMEPDVEAALAEADAAGVLASVQRRAAPACSPHVLARAYEIAAVLGPVAADWIRRQYGTDPTRVLYDLAKATARCLPQDEGFQLVLGALEAVPAGRRHLGALAWFRSELTLDLIERTAERPAVSGEWELAAVSGFSWNRAAAWLHAGRPLSRLALDALLACEVHQTPLLRELSPRLANPAPREEMARVVEEYLQRDSAPRVENVVRTLLETWSGRRSAGDAAG